MLTYFCPSCGFKTENPKGLLGKGRGCSSCGKPGYKCPRCGMPVKSRNAMASITRTTPPPSHTPKIETGSGPRIKIKKV